MQRPQSETVREGKLRAACDRCHDLKNRCIRIGGPDSRCGRCERLDIDCVYRNSSRMGRPKGQRKSSVVQSRQTAEAGHRRMSSSASDIMADISVTVAGRGSVVDGSEVGIDNISSESTALIESPFDVMSFLTSPEGIQQTDLDWSMDFGHQPNTIQDRLFLENRQSTHAVSQGDQSERTGLPSPDPTNSDTCTNDLTPTLTDRLVQLQGRLHRLLSVGDGQSGVDFVQDALEAAKSFLGVLQAEFVSKGKLRAGPSIFSQQMGSAPMSEENPTMAVEGPADTSAVNFITVQQALTCYSYVLSLLDRVVGVLTSRDGEGGVGSDGQWCSTALSLGYFNLASQPDLNAEIVLHLVLRMVQSLRAVILTLASRCKDVVDNLGQPSTGPDSAKDTPTRTIPSPGSLAGMSYAVSDLLVERERLLVERLSSLTGAK